MLPRWRAVRAIAARVRPRDLPLVLARLHRRAAETYVPAGPFSAARRWVRVAGEVAQRLNGGRLIAVEDVIARTDVRQHVANSEAYFADAGWQRPDARKPFGDALEAEHLSRALSVLIPHLELQPGLRLLDFGAGTCWSSLIWASLGCEVIASDVSRNALRFGEERVRADPIGRTLPISFLAYDGVRFDLPDEHVDRIVSIEALHHVLDQPATLRELARVLRPGGIAAFSEPGPLHSLSPQSQFEMAAHGVVENDIHVDAIERSALAAGFGEMRVAWFARPRLERVRDFERIAHGHLDRRQLRGLTRDVVATLANTRIFFLAKTGQRRSTSAARTGLSAALSVEVRRDGARLRGTVHAQNVGAATWLPSGDGHGAVNLGLHRRAPDGTLDVHYAHLPLSDVPVAPGQRASAPFEVPLEGGGALIVDLVAERVAWFSTLGGATLVISLDGLDAGAVNPPARDVPRGPWPA